MPEENIILKENRIDLMSNMEDAAVINKKLVEGGVLVSAIYPNFDSLEEYFMKRIGE